jgi:hypothetical protein
MYFYLACDLSIAASLLSAVLFILFGVHVSMIPHQPNHRESVALYYCLFLDCFILRACLEWFSVIQKHPLSAVHKLS